MVRAPRVGRVLTGLVLIGIVGAGGCGPAAAPAQTPAAAAAAAPSPVAERIAAADLMRVVEEMASPPYEGRRTGTAGGRRARAYIEKAFREVGLEPAGTAGFAQPFRFAGHEDAANLIGRVPGTDAAAPAIVVTAHYDHDGIRNGVLYPGADDNASGIAALLAIARHVIRAPLRHTLVVAALDAEELGLQGAKAFLAHPPVPVARMALNVNLDMVSRSDRREIFAAGPYHTPWLQPVLDAVGRRSAVTLRFGHDRPPTAPGDPEDWTLESDHGEFHTAGVPFVYFGVEDHPDYHQPTDTPDRIDPTFFSGVVETTLDAIRSLDRALAERRQ